MANLPKSSDLSRLNQQQAAYLCGVTARALRDWTDVPRNSDGTYDGAALVRWLIGRASPDEFDNQRERLAAAQADKAEMENAVRRRELADLAQAQRAWSDMIAAARSRILSTPTKLGPGLVGIGDANVIAAAIRAELYAALAELADYVPQVDAEQSDSGDQEVVPDVGAAADPDRKPVGRRKKKAQ